VELLSVLAERFPSLSGEMSQPETLGDLARLCRESGGSEKALASKNAKEPIDQKPSDSPRKTGLSAASASAVSIASAARNSSLEQKSSVEINPEALAFAVLSQETGYPAESLKPEMDLEADLGLDSIKRVEIFSSLSERLNGLDPASLSGVATLGQLIEALAPLAKNDNAAALADPAPGAFLSPLAEGDAFKSDAFGGDGFKSDAFKSRAFENNAFGDISPGRPEISQSQILDLLARETGYPAESLTPAMELEADLGLDSIKKVEILSAMAEMAPDVSNPEREILAQAQTLGDWLDFFESWNKQGHKEKAGSAKPPAKPGNGKDRSLSGEFIGAGFGGSIGSGSIGSGGSIDSGSMGSFGFSGSPNPGFSQTKASSLSESPNPGRAILEAALNSEAYPSLFQVEPVFKSPEAGPSQWPEGGFVRLVGSDGLTRGLELDLIKRGYKVERRSWRYDFDKWKDKPADVLFLVWPGPDRDPKTITQALKALKASGPEIKAVAGLSFLGGSFGFPRPNEKAALGNSISGALVGLLKCAAQEWPNVFTRALDLPLAVYEMPQPGWIAAIVERAAAPGPVELGLSGLGRLMSLALKPYSPAESPEPLLSPGDAVVATGGGRGVTAAVLLELAKNFKPKLIILGRTSIGPPEPAWLANLATDKEIKAALHAASPNLTPKELGERTRLILSSRELKLNLTRLKEAGSTVEYVAGDFTDLAVLEASARKIRAKFGPIYGFIHGAGVLADHPILGKKEEDFARVYGTKTQIAANLLEAFQTEPLKLVAFFSSSTARFGRRGQSDYAAGNEVLNKTAWELSILRPKARILAINWGPWAGGMVGESLAGQFRAEGVGLIGLKEGAETFLRLIRSPVGDPAEVVVLGQGTDLSALDDPFRGTF
jgi:NAD(P)-dependent dehydrogenase (short-subunit alcohol dehydrogenase family)/acyl carrier protein